MAKASLSHQYGLTLGITLGLVHLVWVLLVALELAQPLVDFVVKAHMVQTPHVVQPFTLEAGAVLIVLAMLLGYVIGYVFGQVLSAVQKRT